MIRGLVYAAVIVALAAYFGCSPHNLLDEIVGNQQPTVYRWVDEHGVVHYDSALPRGQRATQDSDEAPSSDKGSGKSSDKASRVKK